ncbi:acyl-CoA reductase [Crocinitomix sp.]|nr:acyl-CoA reductase [Crocinitomix sp.]
MNLDEKIKLLSRLGEILNAIGKDQKWPGFQIGINEEEYENLAELVNRVHIYNGWFTPAAVRTAFLGIASWLNEADLSNWMKHYSVNENNPKSVALIMAGNIPLVGFHDFISVFLGGHKAVVKLSSDDKQLFPALIDTMALFNPEIKNWVDIKENRLEGFDAVIATGSDNSANYFESYFGKYPNIIRKNRTSIALLKGDETKEELEKLGEDVFTFFGLGCRNVSQVWIPKDFDVNRIFEAFYRFNEVANHNKYANNYDYNKAVYLLNLENLLDNGFILFKEDRGLNSPLGMLHIARYDSMEDFKAFAKENEAKIQAIVGKDHIPFGSAQCPSLSDYADGVDTVKFVTNI